MSRSEFLEVDDLHGRVPGLQFLGDDREDLITPEEVVPEEADGESVEAARSVGEIFEFDGLATARPDDLVGLFGHQQTIPRPIEGCPATKSLEAWICVLASDRYPWFCDGGFRCRTGIEPRYVMTSIQAEVLGVKSSTAEALQLMLGGMRTNSALALNILDVCQRPESSAADLSAAIEPDPAISLRILRLANSPMYRGRRDVASIPDAVARVGRSATQSLAVSAALDADNGESCPPDYWENAITSAATAVICSELMENRLPDAFSAGLLVDLGCLLLFRIVPDTYPDLLNEAGTQHQLLADRELELLQLTHCEAGALALHDLGLPMQLCDAVRHHHDRRESGDVGLEAIVAAGVELASVFQAPDETDDAISDRLHQLLGEHPEALRTRIELEVEALRQAAFV